ncbi:MAG: hypothetical protein PGN26_11635 [Xylophilus ampelinus]
MNANARDDMQWLEDTRFALDRMLSELATRIGEEQARPAPDAARIADWERQRDRLRRDRQALRPCDAAVDPAVLERYLPLVRARCAPVMRLRR